MKPGCSSRFLYEVLRTANRLMVVADARVSLQASVPSSLIRARRPPSDYMKKLLKLELKKSRL